MSPAKLALVLFFTAWTCTLIPVVMLPERAHTAIRNGILMLVVGIAAGLGIVHFYS